MRELVYASDAKLRQLLPDLPGGPGRPRATEAEIKTPLGGFKVGKATQEPGSGLAAAVARLEASSRAPRWFADPAVQPGHWVHFEAPLAVGTVADAVVFLDPGEPTEDYPSGGHLRLLLHGSAHYLTGTRSAPSTTDDGNRSLWGRFKGVLASLDAMDSESAQSDLSGTRHEWRIEQVVGHLSRILEPGYTAAWMAGYARVTAKIPTGAGPLLAATPLYVEHIDAPAASE